MRTPTILILLSMILHSHSIREEKDQALIEATCKNTPHHQLCTAVLSSDSRSATEDLTGLSLIMVDAVKTKTKVAISNIQNLTKNGGDPKLTPALNECTNAYDAVLKADIPEAVEALTKGDPKFAENGMADTVVEADECEGSFERLGIKSPLTEVNTAVHDLAEVARAIIRNLL